MLVRPMGRVCYQLEKPLRFGAAFFMSSFLERCNMRKGLGLRGIAE